MAATCPAKKIRGHGPLFDDSYLLIQDEPRVRIVLSPMDNTGNRQVTKIYRTPAELTWRDLFRIPQAQREFQNTEYALRTKLPVVEPLHWGIARLPGRAWYSQLSTAYLQGSTLRAVLSSPETNREQKETLISDSARLLAKMHREGLIWGTPHIGNIMIGPQPDKPLTAFDFPYALCAGRDMRDSSYAHYDLWYMARSCRRLAQLEETLVNQLYFNYAEAMVLHPEYLRLQVEKKTGPVKVFWDRIRLRTLRSFRPRPF